MFDCLIKKGLITIRWTWFGLKTLSEVVEIFDMGRGVDTAIDLSLYIDFISDLGCFIFTPTLVCQVPIFLLTFL